MQVFAELQTCLASDLLISEDLPITSDLSLSSVRALCMRSAFFKKFVDATDAKADDNCLELFLKYNSQCSEFSLKPTKLFHDQVIGEVKHILDDIFFNGPDLAFSSSDLDEGIGIGPGASVGARSFNFYTKLFDSPLTYTDDRLPFFYNRAIASNPTWVIAEKQRNTAFGMTKVAGNKLSFVPKTSHISRSICTEPALNMLFQKGLGAIFERLLRKQFRIDLSVQPELNRDLARRGSIDGSFGTIDLRSASDSVSLNLLKEILPAYVFNWLMIARSPHVTLPSGGVVELHMVSSMGNGFTFPLQTMVFACIVRACYRVLGIQPEYVNGRPSNFGVFGDDIIVRKDAYDFVVDCLGLFGFTVNDQKSFNVGPFRESCGGDYYYGSDVRGVYVKKLSSQADVYSTINRIVRWSAISGVLMPKCLELLTSRVRFRPVPRHAGDTEGIKVPRTAVSAFIRDENGCIYYDALVPLATRFDIPSDETELKRYPSKVKSSLFIGYNPGGIAIALVGGYIRNGRITLRNDNEARFKVQRKKTPCWDFQSEAGSHQVHDWEVTYELLATLCFSFRP